MKMRARLGQNKGPFVIDHRNREMSAITELHGLDVHEVWSLFEFHSTVLHGRSNSFSFVTELLSAIREMGAMLKLFGLAKPVRGTLYAWRPRKRLSEIVQAKLAPLKRPFADKATYNTAVLDALREICDVLSFVVSIEAALGGNPYNRTWRLTLEFEQLVVCKSVQNAYAAATCVPPRPASAARPKLVWSRPARPAECG
jgi:hypothetical protein